MWLRQVHVLQSYDMGSGPHAHQVLQLVKVLYTVCPQISLGLRDPHGSNTCFFGALKTYKLQPDVLR